MGVLVNLGTDVRVTDNGIAEGHELEVSCVYFKIGGRVPRVPKEERQRELSSEDTVVFAHDVEQLGWKRDERF